jgi:hypothetical protein
VLTNAVAGPSGCVWNGLARPFCRLSALCTHTYRLFSACAIIPGVHPTMFAAGVGRRHPAVAARG